MISALVGIFVVVAMIRDMRNPMFWALAAIIVPIGWFITTHESNKSAEKRINAVMSYTNSFVQVRLYDVADIPSSKYLTIYKMEIVRGKKKDAVLKVTLNDGKTLEFGVNKIGEVRVNNMVAY